MTMYRDAFVEAFEVEAAGTQNRRVILHVYQERLDAEGNPVANGELKIRVSDGTPATQVDVDTYDVLYPNETVRFKRIRLK